MAETALFNALHSKDVWKWLYRIINSTPSLKEKQFNTRNMQIYHSFGTEPSGHNCSLEVEALILFDAWVFVHVHDT